MTKKKRPEELWQAKLGTGALNPLQVMDLQEAVRDKKKKTMLDGREFNIKYLPDGHTLWYKPVKGHTPCGYLNIEKILSQL